jgi:heme-binding NEAT domain protein
VTVNHPQWVTMCEICFNGLTVDTCVVDTDGVKWDICKGDCAIQAGIKEKVD